MILPPLVTQWFLVLSRNLSSSLSRVKLKFMHIYSIVYSNDFHEAFSTTATPAQEFRFVISSSFGNCQLVRWKIVILII